MQCLTHKFLIMGAKEILIENADTLSGAALAKMPQFSSANQILSSLLTACKGSVKTPSRPKDFGLICKDGAKVISKGEITLISGKPKTGKSAFVYLMIAALLCGEFACFKAMYAHQKIVLIDTEQQDDYLAQRVKTMYAAAGMNPDEDCTDFAFFHLLSIGKEQRLQALQQIIEFEQPDFIFIDGIADFILDFNDIASSRMLVDKLRSMANENHCGIVTLLHENKTSDNTTPRGHLGTELLNLCSEHWTIRADEGKNSRQAIQVFSRYAPTSGFDFSIDEQGAHLKEPTQRKKATNIANGAILDALKTMPEKSYYKSRELIEAIVKKSGCSERTAYNLIDAAKKDKILSSEGNKYRLTAKAKKAISATVTATVTATNLQFQ